MRYSWEFPRLRRIEKHKARGRESKTFPWCSWVTSRCQHVSRDSWKKLISSMKLCDRPPRSLLGRPCPEQVQWETYPIQSGGLGRYSFHYPKSERTTGAGWGVWHASIRLCQETPGGMVWARETLRREKKIHQAAAEVSTNPKGGWEHRVAVSSNLSNGGGKCWSKMDRASWVAVLARLRFMWTVMNHHQACLIHFQFKGTE